MKMKCKKWLMHKNEHISPGTHEEEEEEEREGLLLLFCNFLSGLTSTLVLPGPVFFIYLFFKIYISLFLFCKFTLKHLPSHSSVMLSGMLWKETLTEPLPPISLRSSEGTASSCWRLWNEYERKRKETTADIGRCHLFFVSISLRTCCVLDNVPFPFALTCFIVILWINPFFALVCNCSSLRPVTKLAIWFLMVLAVT